MATVAEGRVAPRNLTYPKGMPMLKQTLEYYIARFRTNEEGATAVEYGVLIALIIAVIIAIIFTIGEQLLEAFTTVSDELP
jgi:pilus assembly protein Flp/PilA